MRLKQYFIPTLKEIPRDAHLPSQQLMLRSGLIEKISSGLYAYLPLGLKILKKIENIIRQQMNETGALECQMPLLIEQELLMSSKRWQTFKEELFRLQDRHQHHFALAPTHEEMITFIAKNKISSYKQLPLNLYQFTAKFRDEVRPRFGVMRAREFMMKDAYSFHSTTESLTETYQKMSKTYAAIFKELDLDFVRVKADSGAIGGDASEEFMVKSKVGEDEIAICNVCRDATNLEKLTATYTEVPQIITGTKCPFCQQGSLDIIRGIEVGHIFQLQDKYSKALGFSITNKNGQPQFPLMGCYGIGINRSLAAIIEQNHDQSGIIWAKKIAPFTIILLTLDMKNKPCYDYSTKIYREFLAKKIDILWDDREERPGFKFKDADLLGIPYQIIVGKKSLAKDEIEIKTRNDNVKHKIKSNAVLKWIQERL